MTEIKLTEQQLSAVEMVKGNQLSILTGGPGTGKTTTVKEILNWALQEGLCVQQCAPTGKAAKRMMEATGFPASTIHSALEGMVIDDSFMFTRNEGNPLNCDLLIADELSMVSTDLMADLMRAVNHERTKVLFVGDQGQLPSVGPGAVLRDLLAAGCIPHVELTVIHRNSGEIVKSCHKIAKGERYEPCSELNIEEGLNLRHVESTTPEKIQVVIQKIIQKMVDRGYDPVWDIQVISPTNSRSALSCNALNAVLQDQLNPLPEGVEQEEGFLFREKDKVIQIKNKKIDEEDGTPSFVVNGDMGEVLRIDDVRKKILVRFHDPERYIELPKKMNDLLLAYCCTCHRMQGSEAPVVIIPVHKTFQYFVNRSWIYTAISRAKQICFTVGQFKAIELAIQNEGSNKRETRLKEKILERYIEAEEI